MPSVYIKDTFKLRTGVCILASRPNEATLILDKIISAFPQLQFLESKFLQSNNIIIPLTTNDLLYSSLIQKNIQK